ncbi:leucine-rich repeat-containing protein 57-like [Copidosoma floridanum]|uniref:leucine-rich repeat-containing protein 57-like n=1 Tax=Copidosoma floridanum TaxID=29053 RepID=UPI0006C98604|nr:leucine-rich repeat-containing protein 57-like [Copidosoma floridanum]
MGNLGLRPHYETSKRTGALNLSQRNLDEFPQQLATLDQLRNLDLSSNKFSRLPSEVGKFSLLKQLNVSGNRLTELPDIIGDLVKLETLNASFNKIGALPSSLAKLSHLKQVNLSDNRLTDFPRMFCGMRHLDLLDLSHNKITSIPDEASDLYVTELNLNKNQISSISPNLADCPRLKTLRLEENCLKLDAIHKRILEDSKISVLAVEGNLFEMKQLADLDGYDKYMERYTAVKKKMF